jgi:hypothetical protein
MIRFYFDTLDSVGNDFFGWMVDDINITTYTCVPPTEGGLVVGNVYDLNTSAPVNGAWVTNETGSLGYAVETPDDPAVDDAFYTVYSLSGSQVHTATFDLYGEDVQTVGVVDFDTVGQDFYLPSGFIITDPTAYNVSLELGTNTTLPLTITDIGGGNVEFLIGEEAGTNPFAQPAIHIPVSDGNFPRGEAAPSFLAPPKTDKVSSLAGAANTPLVLGGGALAYGAEFFSDQFVSFTTDNPSALTNINSMGGALYFGGDFSGGDFATLYAVNYNNNTLYAIDTATGVATAIGPMTPVSGGTWTGMSEDSNSGTMYASSTPDCNTNTLYTVDLSTGAATDYATITGYCIIDIAINANGDMYAVDIIGDQLLSIDKSNGNVTVIGSIGFDANFAQGMSFDEAADILYLAAYNNSTGQGELRIADVSTGNTTVVGLIGSGASELDAFSVATGGGGGDVPWVSEVPISGTVPANGDFIVDVTFDAAQVPVPGQYTAFLNIAVDTPQLEVTIPLTLNVTCASCGTLEGDITDAATSLPLTSTIHITSTGGFDLSIEDVTSYSAILAPGQYYVNASASGYLSETAVVDIFTGVTTTQDFALYANTSILSFSPAFVEESMNIGDVVSNTVTVTNTGAASMDFEVNIGGYSGPFTLVPISTVPLNPANTADNKATKVGTATGLTQFGTGEVQYPETPFVLPEAGGGLLLDQQPNQSNGIFADASCDLCGGAQVLAENFVLADTKTIGAINIWSGYYPTDSPVPDNITVIFHQDAGGAPGPAVSTETAVPNVRTQTGVILFGVHEYFHEFSLNNPVTLSPGTYWVEIYNDTGFGTDDYFWEVGNADTIGNGLPGSAFAFEAPGSFWNIDGFTDLAIQLVEGSASGGWAYAVPDFGSVPGFSVTTFELVFDARSLFQTGDYYAELSFSGSFANDPATMPLTMHLDCPTCGFLVGDIYDAFTTAPVEADVFVSSTNGTAITLTNVTSYSLALQPGTYDFLVTADGYFSGTATVTLEQGATVETDFALVPIVAILEYSPSSYERTVVLGSVLTDSLVLNNTGTVAFDFFLSDVGLGAPGLLAPVTTCPEDAFGYTCTDSNEPGGPTYNFEDISGTGTQVFLGDDQVSPAVPLGFTFDYYEVDYTDVYISSNGFLTFLNDPNSGCCSGQPIPTPGTPDGIIAAWWEDLYPPGGGTITYQTLGSAPNRVFIVQFTGIDHYPGIGLYNTFQFKLFESGDVIEIHYQDAPSDGGTHSAGIENETGTVGLQYFLGSSGLSTPLAVRYTRATDALWLLELPATGTVDAGSSAEVNIIFDASVITQTGTYTAELRFDGTFNNVVAPAPVVMHVVDSGTAGVTVGPDQADTGIIGTSVSYSVAVTNTGDISDNFVLSAVSDQGWNVSLPGNIVLDPGETGTVTVIIDVPVGATAGDVDVTTVTATSTFDGSVSDSADLTTTVLAYDVDLEADQSGEGAPGDTVTYTLTVQNTGTTTDTIGLAVAGNAWTTTLSDSTVTLAAGDSATIVVSVTISGSAADGDDDVATVTATSQGDPTQTDSVTVTTTAVVIPIPETEFNIYLPIVHNE